MEWFLFGAGVAVASGIIYLVFKFVWARWIVGGLVFVGGIVLFGFQWFDHLEKEREREEMERQFSLVDADDLDLTLSELEKLEYTPEPRWSRLLSDAEVFGNRASQTKYLMRGRALNGNAEYTINLVKIELTFRDCKSSPPESLTKDQKAQFFEENCVTIATAEPTLWKKIPPKQARDFEIEFLVPFMEPENERVLTYDIGRIRAVEAAGE